MQRRLAHSVGSCDGVLGSRSFKSVSQLLDGFSGFQADCAGRELFVVRFSERVFGDPPLKAPRSRCSLLEKGLM